MTRLVLLNNVDHADLTVAAGHGPAFGDAVNQALVFPSEWQDLQREYPILFRRGEDGRFHSVVLLGLDRDENLFLKDDAWLARYVPALHQRGPFSIGLHRSKDDDAEGEPMIHVDLNHARVMTDDQIVAGEGQKVFLEHGGNSPYLDAVTEVLRRIHAGVTTNDPMFAAFEAEGLIEPVTLEIAIDDTMQYTLDDLHTISAARMAGLDGAALARLHEGGFLGPAFWVAASLANVSRLIDLKIARRAR